MKPYVLSAIAVVGLSAAWPAAAQMYGGGGYTQSRDYSSTKRMTPEERAQAEKQKKLATLRKEALKLQKQDGGTLSAEHKAYVEGRMAEINGTNAMASATAPAARPPQ